MKGWRIVIALSLLLGLFGCTGRADKTVVSAESMTLTLHGMRGSSVYEYSGETGELQRCRMYYQNGEDVLVPEQSTVCEMQRMTDLMNACGILRWNGFHGKHPRNVQDGIMFRFTASVNGGQTISADGSENFPKGYHEFVKALDAMLAESENKETTEQKS